LGVLIKVQIKSYTWSEKREASGCEARVTLSPMTFWPLISQIWWSVNRPLRAAELSWTMELMRPFLKMKPSWPFRSLWRVTLRSSGLQTGLALSAHYEHAHHITERKIANQTRPLTDKHMNYTETILKRKRKCGVASSLFILRLDERFVRAKVCEIRECLIEENWHWLVTSGFWTGCSNASVSMRGRSRSSAE